MAFTSKNHPFIPLLPNANLHATKNNEIAVVGIGACAGGLRAMQEFFLEDKQDEPMAC